MEDGRCPFIPGKILGKIYSALLYLGKCNTRPRIGLAELENLTVMATEHFQEHILPVIRYRKRLAPSQREFSLHKNTSALFSAVEQPGFLFSTDLQCITANSGRRDYANENSGKGDSSAVSAGNDSSSHKYAANKGCRPSYNSIVSCYLGEYSDDKYAGPQLNTPAFPAPGCSWMNKSYVRPQEIYSVLQDIANDIQYLKSCQCYQSLQISAQEIKLRKQASLINEQRKKICKMEIALAESNHKYTQLKKKFEMLCNNYTKLSGTSTTRNAFVPGSTNLVEGICENETISCNINETSGDSEIPWQSKITSAEVHMQESVKATLLNINKKKKEKIEVKAGPSQINNATSAFPSKRGVKRMRNAEESESISE
ncbi:hypothetical protein R5R35_006561 [Gryllus longicercus]|uniref:Uncharacterized protein n=2 Tax=Gryllus longicercus TaxID=2509291 RepID=A0AAN9VEZ2_9ORTH